MSAPLPTRHQKQPYRFLPPNVSLHPVTPTLLPAYRRLITLLLPICYPSRFYADTIAHPALALCATWSESPPPPKRNFGSLDGCTSSTPTVAEPKVIAGIQCRLEPLPTSPTASCPAPPRSVMYIQTLAVLAPYRSLGIATALLDAVVGTGIRDASANVVEVYAHVWEANEDALEWYGKRGFLVEKGVIEGYYRKLRPSGARVVRRKVGVGEWLRVMEVKDGGGGVVDRKATKGQVVDC